jgi:hypothetical protein
VDSYSALILDAASAQIMSGSRFGKGQGIVGMMELYTGMSWRCMGVNKLDTDSDSCVGCGVRY